jgi:hypothetical protein
LYFTASRSNAPSARLSISSASRKSIARERVHPIVRPHGRPHPLPVLDDFGVDLVDERADLRNRSPLQSPRSAILFSIFFFFFFAFASMTLNAPGYKADDTSM